MFVNHQLPSDRRETERKGGDRRPGDTRLPRAGLHLRARCGRLLRLSPPARRRHLGRNLPGAYRNLLCGVTAFRLNPASSSGPSSRPLRRSRMLARCAAPPPGSWGLWEAAAPSPDAAAVGPVVPRSDRLGSARGEGRAGHRAHPRGTRRSRRWPYKDDDIEEGDLPEHKRPSAPVDFSKIDPGKPESILKMTKKGKTLMMFVTVSGQPTEKETEEITSLWQGSLFNANYDVQRFIVGSDRAIFMLRDGSYAWEIKDFLVSQDRCADVTLEGQVYPGKGGGSKEKNKTKQEKGKKKKEGEPRARVSKEDNRAGSRREDL